MNIFIMKSVYSDKFIICLWSSELIDSLKMLYLYSGIFIKDIKCYLGVLFLYLFASAVKPGRNCMKGFD